VIGAESRALPAGRSLLDHPAVPYTVPFVAFLLLLAIQDWVPLPQSVEFGTRLLLLAAILWIFSRRVLDFGMSRPVASIALGLVVFVLWVLPDVLVPGYREHWLFHNSIVGGVRTSLRPGSAENVLTLGLRTARAVLIVPLVEELFWRGWLMRWIIRKDFTTVPLGAWSARAVWIVALLFAAEHGPYWDVGLAAGLIYNLWMCRVKRLGDLIWAHAVTNAALCAYVLYTHKWEFWL
jgi:CAAX prenyl protease-like protein